MIGSQVKSKNGPIRRFEMKKVLVRGPVLTQSGYGVHCRQIAKWCLSKNQWDVKFQALPWGDTPWIINPNYHDGLINQIMRNTVEVTPDQEFDISVQLQLPNEWDCSIAKTNVGVTAGVETSICNPVWVQNCNQMDMVIVPSVHTKQVFERSGKIEKPLVVVPEAYCEEVEKIGQEDVDALPKFSTDFNFLVFGQITGDNPLNDRKNIFYTLKWLCESFKDDESVGVVIKTNTGRNTFIDKKRTHDLIQTVVKECRKGPFPKIHVLHGDMNDKSVASLYKHPQIKALITLTRGEGFGLPILEAAASDLPIIATGWSGHIDFLNHGKYINVSYALKDIHKSRVDNRIFMPQSQWAEANEDDFKKKVLKFKAASNTPKEWAAELGKVIRQKYSSDSISKHYDDVLKEYL